MYLRHQWLQRKLCPFHLSLSLKRWPFQLRAYTPLAIQDTLVLSRSIISARDKSWNMRSLLSDPCECLWVTLQYAVPPFSGTHLLLFFFLFFFVFWWFFRNTKCFSDFVLRSYARIILIVLSIHMLSYIWQSIISSWETSTS